MPSNAPKTGAFGWTYHNVLGASAGSSNAPKTGAFGWDDAHISQPNAQ